MMICPETFYEERLKGKDSEGIKKVIASLKREMAKLKRTMEHPDYAPIMYPTEDTRLWCSRLYLERAKQALKEAGEVYIPTAAEQRVLDFDANIPNISRIYLRIGGFCYGWQEVEVTLGDCVSIDVNNMPFPKREKYLEGDEYTKEDFLAELMELHIGEWRKEYDLQRYGFYVCDGTQWELTIEYNNGCKPHKIEGDNAYPYNFKDLLTLLEIDHFFLEEDNEGDDDE